MYIIVMFLSKWEIPTPTGKPLWFVSVKEVESRLRKLFQQLKPGVAVTTKVGDIIGALLTEHIVLLICLQLV